MPRTPSTAMPTFAAKLLVAGCLLAAAAAHASLTARVSSTCIDSLGGIETINPETIGGSSHCNFTSSNAEHTASGNALTQIKAGQRRLGIDSKATASLSRVHDYMTAATIVQTTGFAYLVDDFDTVAKDAQGNRIAAGYMDVDILASGVVSLSGSGAGLSGYSSSQLSYRIAMLSAGNVEASFSINYADTVPVDAVFTARWYWEAGSTNLTMEVRAMTSAFMTATGSAAAHVDFGNSLHWLGVRNVTDLTGVPVASFSMVSAGTNVDWSVYTPPVPEPATWGLMLAGLGLVGWSACRGRRGALRRPSTGAGGPLLP
jgi:hypothetical protein